MRGVIVRKSNIARHITVVLFAAAAFTAVREAAAAGKEWGLHNGNTMNGGGFMPYAEVGWPDVSLGVQYGISDGFDIGGRVSLSYSPSYGTGTAVGMGARVPIRISLMKGPKVSGLLHFDPGIKIAMFSPMAFGIQVPIGVEFGLHLIENGTLQLGLDVPLNLNLTNGTVFTLAPMAGPGFEYHIGEHMTVGASTRFGAAIAAGGAGGFTAAGAGFGVLGQAYFGYKM